MQNNWVIHSSFIMDIHHLGREREREKENEPRRARPAYRRSPAVLSTTRRVRVSLRHRRLSSSRSDEEEEEEEEEDENSDEMRYVD